MSYFDNANNRVTRKSFGSKVDKEFKREGVIPVKDRKKVDTLAESAAKYKELNKKVDERKLTEVKEQRAFEAKLHECYTNLKEDLMKDIISEICVESLLVDEDVVNANLKSIVDMVNEQVENIGGFTGIKHLAESTKNPLLKNMVNICEETSKKVGERNLKECGGKVDKLNFGLNKIELDEYDCRKKEMGIDTIIGNVKDKVFKVVQDEQELNNNKQMIMDEIQNKVSEIQAPVEEAMKFIFEAPGIEEDTLFNSIMRNRYKQLLATESSAIFESFDYKEERQPLFEDQEFLMSDIELIDEELEDDEIIDKYLNECQQIYESYKEGDDVFFNNIEKLCDSIVESTSCIKTKREAKFYNNLIRGIQKILEDTDTLILSENDELKGEMKEFEKEIKGAEDTVKDTKNKKGVAEEVILCPKFGKEQCNCKVAKESEEVTEGWLSRKIDNAAKKSLSKQIAKRDFAVVRVNLTNHIAGLKSESEIERIEKDFEQGKEQIKEAIKRHPEAKENLEAHLKWMDTTGRNLIRAKRKELKKKGVVETYISGLDDVCGYLNNIIETHEYTYATIHESLYHEVNGQRTMVPYLQTSDCNLNNLEFIYKTRCVCESLKASLRKLTSIQEANIVEKAVELNIKSINETIDLLKDNTNMSYKLKVLNTGKKYLQKIQEAIDHAELDYNDEIIESAFMSPDDVEKAFSQVREYYVLESTDNELMEMVMAEAIVEYTILETMNTLRLVDYTKENVRQMARKNISYVSEGLFGKK